MFRLEARLVPQHGRSPRQSGICVTRLARITLACAYRLARRFCLGVNLGCLGGVSVAVIAAFLLAHGVDWLMDTEIY
jgi:hypothetical protein